MNLSKGFNRAAAAMTAAEAMFLLPGFLFDPPYKTNNPPDLWFLYVVICLLSWLGWFLVGKMAIWVIAGFQKPKDGIIVYPD